MKSLKIAIIGGGFFGSSIAIELKEKFSNFKIDLFEKKDDLLKGTSGKNQFRLHKGYHYPRSKDTYLECRSSNESFNKKFKDCFLKSNNFYSIAKYGSKVTFDQYQEYLNRVNLHYKVIKKHKLINEDMSQGIISVNEKIIDIHKARSILNKKITSLGINAHFNYHVDINKKFNSNYDLVILSTYENNNYLKKKINIETEKYYYQLVEKIIVKTPKSFKKFSCVVLDGNFMSIDPYNEKLGLHVCGHVKKSVIKSANTKDIFRITKNEKSKLDDYLINLKKSSLFGEFKKDFIKYFNYFGSSEYKNSFIVVRCTKKNKNDERITSIDFNGKVISVHSGKWINCIETAKNIAKII